MTLTHPTRRVGAALAAPSVALTLGLAACSSDDEQPAAGVAASKERTDEPGGTIKALSLGPVLSWDPQRISGRDDAAFAGRTFIRTLTAYQPSTNVADQARLVGDLATDTGTPNAAMTQWSFRLRKDVAWEDGTPVTCADVKYGISRSYASDDITGGPTDAIAVLAVPKTPDGTPTYAGPYATGKEAAAGIAAYDKAVTCKGETITFTLSTPVSDFNEMVAGPAFAPVKKSVDKGRAGTFAVFSNGPYKLADKWRASTGGTWVRNPHWKKSSDEVRSAYPDRIEYQEGIETRTVAQQILADGDTTRTAVSMASAPPAIQQHLESSDQLSERAVTTSTGLIDYLAPNFKSPIFATQGVRQAFAVATNREAYVTALGGASTGQPTVSLIPESLPAHHSRDPIGAGRRGDPARAKKMLADAGVKTPVPLRVVYRTGGNADKAMAGLVATWTEAGFAPKLIPIKEEYFTVIAQPEAVKAYDVFWSNWAPSWASGSTIFPALFDSSINLNDSGTGTDYGSFASAPINAEIKRINSIRSRDQREKAWAALDEKLLLTGGYVALAERRALYLAGSDVRNFSANAVIGGVIEFADIAVAQ